MHSGVLQEELEEVYGETAAWAAVQALLLLQPQENGWIVPLIIDLHYMPIIFQAKEQGKADVEELLSKLEKVTNQTCQIDLNAESHNYHKVYWLSFLYFVFSDQFWAAGENPGAPGQTVQGKFIVVLVTVIM